MNPTQIAVDNIAKYGDTDVYPFQMENSLIYDLKKEFSDLVESTSKDVKGQLDKYPLVCLKSCSPTGYNGFRWTTLIDPLWNAVLLQRVVTIANDLEAKRVATSKNCVFSYRYKVDKSKMKLFDENYNWKSYKKECLKNARKLPRGYVVSIDISDFYNRIYHHRLDNMLRRSTKNTSAINDIMEILQKISASASYGLPVGGNAARLLAEMLLNGLDHMMLTKRIKFCRFVDDIVIFAESHEDAYKFISWCAKYLLENEGLSLQKSKTNICSSDEYAKRSELSLKFGDERLSREKSALMQLHIHFDPYSPTAVMDYEKLKGEISKYDIMGLLKDELRKTQINLALGRQLLSSIKTLDDNEMGIAISLILDNMDIFYPIFPQVIQLILSAPLRLAPKQKIDAEMSSANLSKRTLL